jgi:hypothetical protein
MAGQIPVSGWYPGDSAQGFRVEAAPVLDAQTHGFQKGQASLTYTVTSPGTVASAGTVGNTTGVDCVVYAKATSGLGPVSVGGVSIGGSASANTTITVLVPAFSSIAVTYGGTLSWVWQAK